MEERIFSATPNHRIGCFGDFEPVVVIQTMILSDNHFLCEVMWKSDFDEIFKENEQQDK